MLVSRCGYWLGWFGYSLLVGFACLRLLLFVWIFVLWFDFGGFFGYCVGFFEFVVVFVCVLFWFLRCLVLWYLVCVCVSYALGGWCLEFCGVWILVFLVLVVS